MIAHFQYPVEAKLMAIAAHEALGQKRKQTGSPYWYHLEEVANECQIQYGRLEINHNPQDLLELLAAAWLHDTVEDTKIDLDLITSVFGVKVREIVDGVTKIVDTTIFEENGKTKEWLTNNKIDNGGWAIKLLKLCDTKCNLRNCIEQPADPVFVKKFVAKKRRMMKEILWPTRYEPVVAEINEMMTKLERLA